MPFDVEGARKEGYDDSQIAEFLAKQNRFNLQGARKEGYSDSDIVGFLTKTKQAPKVSEPGILEKAKGAVEAGVGLASGATTGALGFVGGALGGLAGQIRQGELGTQAGAERVARGAQEASQKLTYEPPSEAGKEALGAAGQAIEASGVAGIAPDVALASQVGRTVPAAVQQVAKVPGEVAGGVAKALTPMPEPRVAALAKKAIDLGIPLRPDQLSTNRVARMVGEALEKVPLSGSKALQRQIGFNKSLGKLIGAEDSDHLTPDVFSRAMEKSGSKIGDIAKETPITVDAETQKVFADRLDQAKKFETRDVARVVNSYVNELSSKVQNGVLDGETFRKINSQLGTQIRSSQGDMKRALSELQSDMHDTLEKNIKSPERLQELQEARKQYAIGKTIEPLVAKATTTGDISPGGLLGRVTADKAGKSRMARGRGGELGDLAEIGKLFLKEPQSSGTAERAAAYGLVGGAGYIEPHTAAGVVGAANIYNRLGPAMTRRALRDVEATKSRSSTRRPRAKTETPEEQFALRTLIGSEPAQEPLKRAVSE